RNHQPLISDKEIVTLDLGLDTTTRNCLELSSGRQIGARLSGTSNDCLAQRMLGSNLRRARQSQQIRRLKPAGGRYFGNAWLAVGQRPIFAEPDRAQLARAL